MDEFPDNEQVIIHYGISFVNLCFFFFFLSKIPIHPCNADARNSFSIAKTSAVDISSLFS